MTRTKISALALLVVGGFVSSGVAKEIGPDRIREEFARSGDSQLELAADALGDDGIMEKFDKLKNSPDLEPAIQKIIQKLRGK